MKILMLGEYSGYYSNLAIGFEKLGHEVSLFNNGHGWMQLSAGRPYPSYDGRFTGRLMRRTMLSWDRKLFAGFDLVYIINAEFLKWTRFHPNTWDWIRANNKRVIYTVCGQRDSNLHRYFPYARKHMFLKSDGTIDLIACSKSPPNTDACDQLVRECDGITTIGATYDLAYANVEKPRACIPLPVATEAIDFSPMNIGASVQIFHGKQHRPDCKGTDAILEGISSLQERKTSLPFEFRHSGGHALSEYLKILAATDISIDQCKSMGYGMNGLFSMALGKVVCAGNEPEHQKALGLPTAPVVNLPFDSAEIADILEDLLSRPKRQLEEIGRANRAYVEQYHEATIVAQRHLDFAESLG